MDSSAIVWQMKALQHETKSYTIGFGTGKNDETPDAARVAEHFQTKHHTEYLSESELANLADLMWYFDEPLGASSMCPTFLVSKVARKDITVVISGDGGDEAFVGYNRYDRLLNLRLNASGLGHLRSRLSQQKQKVQTPNTRLIEQYRQATTPRFPRLMVADLFSGDLTDIENDKLWFFETSNNWELSGVKQLQWLDVQTFLPKEVLAEVDRASMANSLEVRSPFLDHRHFEWIFALDEKVYFNGEKKRLLKLLLEEHLPRKIRNKPTQGFSAPVSNYWNSQRCNHILAQAASVEDGLFSKQYVASVISQPESSASYAQRWLLTIFKLWYRKWCR